jgi:hypothetical protein
VLAMKISLVTCSHDGVSDVTVISEAYGRACQWASVGQRRPLLPAAVGGPCRLETVVYPVKEIIDSLSSRADFALRRFRAEAVLIRAMASSHTPSGGARGLYGTEDSLRVTDTGR